MNMSSATRLSVFFVLMAGSASAASFSLDLSAEWGAGPANYLGYTAPPPDTGALLASDGSATDSAAIASSFDPDTSSIKSATVASNGSVNGSGAAGRAFSQSGILVEGNEIYLDGTQYFSSFVTLNISGALTLTSEPGGTWAAAGAEFWVERDDTGETIQRVERTEGVDSTLSPFISITDARETLGAMVSCGADISAPFSHSYQFEILSPTSATYGVSVKSEIRGQTGTVDCDNDSPTFIADRFFGDGLLLVDPVRDGSATALAPVPLPASLSLLGGVLAGLAALGGWIRRSR